MAVLLLILSAIMAPFCRAGGPVPAEPGNEEVFGPRTPRDFDGAPASDVDSNTNVAVIIGAARMLHDGQREQAATWSGGLPVVSSRRAGVYLPYDGANIGIRQANDEFPESSMFLWYQEPIGLNPKFFMNSKIYQRSISDADLGSKALQIGFEFSKRYLGQSKPMDLAGMIEMFESKDATFSRVKSWAEYLRDLNRPIFFRPMSEMNYGDGPWELGWKDSRGKMPNTPQQFAKAWILLRHLFRDVGASNVYFMFDFAVNNPAHEDRSGQASVARKDEVVKILESIPEEDIDIIGFHPYSRAWPNVGNDPIPLAKLAEPFLQIVRGSHHSRHPLAIGEMGVAGNPMPSNLSGQGDPNLWGPSSEKWSRAGLSFQAWDAKRVTWIRDGFAYACANGFELVAYFDSVVWSVTPKSLAHSALAEAIRDFNQCAR